MIPIACAPIAKLPALASAMTRTRSNRSGIIGSGVRSSCTISSATSTVATSASSTVVDTGKLPAITSTYISVPTPAASKSEPR